MIEVSSHATHEAYYGYYQEDVTGVQSVYRAAFVHISRRMRQLPGTKAMPGGIFHTFQLGFQICYCLTGRGQPLTVNIILETLFPANAPWTCSPPT